MEGNGLGDKSPPFSVWVSDPSAAEGSYPVDFLTVQHHRDLYIRQVLMCVCDYTSHKTHKHGQYISMLWLFKAPVVQA